MWISWRAIWGDNLFHAAVENPYDEARCQVENNAFFYSSIIVFRNVGCRKAALGDAKIFLKVFDFLHLLSFVLAVRTL